MKKKIVSVCLTAMLVGGLSMTSMQEARAAEGKVIDGSELTSAHATVAVGRSSFFCIRNNADTAFASV